MQQRPSSPAAHLVQLCRKTHAAGPHSPHSLLPQIGACCSCNCCVSVQGPSQVSRLQETSRTASGNQQDCCKAPASTLHELCTSALINWSLLQSSAALLHTISSYTAAAVQEECLSATCYSKGRPDCNSLRTAGMRDLLL